MYAAYCMWRFNGTDPADFLDCPDAADERMRAVRVAFALRAGEMESAITDLGDALGSATEVDG